MIDYLRLNGLDLHDYNGATFEREVAHIDGLVGLPAPKGDSKPRAEAHGGTYRAKFLSSKVITVEGEVWGDTIADAYAGFDELTDHLERTLSEGPKLLTWQRAGGGLALQSRVRLGGAIEPPIEEGAALLRYQVQLEQDDPRAYSQATRTVVGAAITTGGGGFTFPFKPPLKFVVSEGGAAVVTNPGKLPTPPIVRVYGPATSPSYALQSSGQTVTLRGEIATGDYLEVDHEARTVKINGTTLRMNLLDALRSTFFDVPPDARNTPAGPSSVRMFTSTFGVGTHIEVVTKDAYSG